MAPGLFSIILIFQHLVISGTVYFCNLYFSIYTTKIPKIFILLSLSDLTFASGREGIDNPFIALVARFLIVCAGTKDLRVVSYWIIPWFSKTEGNTYATLLHHPFLFKGKPTHAQEVARRISGVVAGEAHTKSSQDLISRQRAISGAVVGESTHKSIHTMYLSQTLIPRITLFAICLSFSSTPLHPCRFIRPLPFVFFV